MLPSRFVRSCSHDGDDGDGDGLDGEDGDDGDVDDDGDGDENDDGDDDDVWHSPRPCSLPRWPIRLTNYIKKAVIDYDKNKE